MSPEKMTQAWNPDKEPGEAVSKGGRTEWGEIQTSAANSLNCTEFGFRVYNRLEHITQTHPHFHLCSPDLVKVTWKCEACPLDGEKLLSQLTELRVITREAERAQRGKVV